MPFWRAMKPPRSRQAFAALCVFVAAGILYGEARAEDTPEPPDYPTIAEQAARQIEKDPADEKARAKLVDALIYEPDLDRAKKALADWREKVPHPSPEILRMEGWLEIARENDDKAIDAWKQYLALTPDDAKTWRALAEACSRQHQWQLAIAAISRAIGSNPTAADLVLRAGYYIRCHDWDRAGKDIHAANEIDATNVALQTLYPAFERKQEWMDGMKKLDAVLRDDPHDLLIQEEREKKLAQTPPEMMKKLLAARLDRVEWLAGEEFLDAANDDAREALKQDPKSLRARLWCGVLAWSRNDGEHAGDVMQFRMKEVTPEFEKELKITDASADPEARANFLLKYHQPLMALRETEKIEGSPAKARALADLDRLAEAGAAARDAVKAHPQDAGAWLAMAKVELENGNLKEAIDAAERSMKSAKSPEAESIRKTAQERLGKK